MSSLGRALCRTDLTVARRAQMKDWIVEFQKKKKRKKKETSADLFHMKEFHSEERRPQNKKKRGRACGEIGGGYGPLIKSDTFSHLLVKDGEKDELLAGQPL